MTGQKHILRELRCSAYPPRHSGTGGIRGREGAHYRSITWRGQLPRVPYCPPRTSSDPSGQRKRQRPFRHTIRRHPTQALGHLMRDDEQQVWVVLKVAFAPVIVSRWRHFAADRAEKGTVEWEFGNVSSSRGIHFRISTVSILRGKRVSSVGPTNYRGCRTLKRSLPRRFDRNRSIPLFSPA